jgi:3-hydroxy-9,10-secoandrosta-1,3,5(10)-triene-9,17-dione monooxygenase
MTHQVVRRVEELAAQLAATAEKSERLGRLSDESVKLVREAGVMRLLQPADAGGYAAHPRDFAEAVMATARQCGSAGWVCGVGGVHQWEVALMDRRLQAEIWAGGQEPWIASPYAPQGVARPVDGGYLLSGHWNFSSGTDHCDWALLGALLGDADGRPVRPMKVLHVVLPRADYAIDEDSWDVIGLVGTGSKDVVAEDAFVPAYRTVDADEVAQGAAAAQRAGRDDALYKVPFWVIYPLGVTASVIGMAEGVLAAHVAYQRGLAAGGNRKTDPYNAHAVSEAAADIAASRTQLLDDVSRIYDQADRGRDVSAADRALSRRDQVRCAWRAVTAADQIFACSGGNAVRRGTPIQRFWRDAHVGLQHAIHAPGPVYRSAALNALGLPAEP